MSDTVDPLGTRLARGGSALLLARLFSRVFDLVRMLTIARWLGPGEMGVYAVASLAITALEQLSETGLRPALVQRRGDLERYLLPVRTVQLLRGLLLGAVIYLAAPLMAGFFSCPRSIQILQVCALLPVVRGAETLFATLAQKELRFAPQVLLQLLAALAGLAVGIAAALIRPDAWSMVWSALAAALVTSIGSHVLARGRGIGISFSWRSLADLHRFSFWVFINGVVSYLFLRGGDWLVGRLLSVRDLALYQMALFICTTATIEVGMVVSQMSFPLFSQLQENPVRLRHAFSQSMGMLAMVSIPLAGLVCSAGRDLIMLTLGDSWLSMLPLFPWLSAWGVCAIFAGTLSGLLYALNRPRLWTFTVVCMLALLVCGALPLTLRLGGLGMAMLMASIGLLMLAMRLLLVCRLLGLQYRDTFLQVMIPGLATVLAVFLAQLLRRQLSSESPLTGLAVTLPVTCCVYLASLYSCRHWLDPSPVDLLRRLRRRPTTGPAVSAAGGLP